MDVDELVDEGFDPGLSGQAEFLLYWESMVNVSLSPQTSHLTFL